MDPYLKTIHILRYLQKRPLAAWLLLVVVGVLSALAGGLTSGLFSWRWFVNMGLIAPTILFFTVYPGFRKARF